MPMRTWEASSAKVVSRTDRLGSVREAQAAHGGDLQAVGLHPGTLASYLHLHWAGQPSIASRLVWRLPGDVSKGD